MLSTRTAGLVALAIGAVGVVAAFLVSGHGAVATTSRSAEPASPRPKPAFTAPLDVPILMYHYVDGTPPDTGADSAALTVSPEQFTAEMDYLAENGYHPVTIAEVYAAVAGKGDLAAKPVAITFDDGGLDNYTEAFPILRDHGFSATFFVITGYVGNRRCMSWDQLREMQDAGMEIESHTYSHPDLRKVDAARLAHELQQSRAQLAEELGSDALFLSYPQGRSDRTVVAAAEAAGYLAAVRTRSFWGPFASDSCFLWQQTNVRAGMSLAAFGRAVAGPGPASAR